ncbi:response regulator transcription factor [bacterium]|nr:response regulator transcription factor [bacterium]
MAQLSALIVDDESLARGLLKELLAEVGGVEVVGEAATGCEALLLVEQLGPEVVFMDIQMPEMNGLEAARRLSLLEKPPRLVFVTAFDHYALPAFEVEAIDYLLKPVESERLAQAVARLQRSLPQDLGGLLRALEAARPLPLTRLALLDERTGLRHVVKLEEIVWVSADNEKTYVRLSEGCLRSMDTLGGLEEKLPPQSFMRVHRSYLVNLDRVRRVELCGSGSYDLELSGSDRKIPLSRHYAPLFKKQVSWD